MKNQTFGEMFPLGICYICLNSCDPNAIVHYECALTFVEEKKRRLKHIEDKKLLLKNNGRLGIIIF